MSKAHIKNSRDHANLAEQYCADVLSGKVPASKYVKLAVQRHIDDLQATKQKQYPYTFDADAGARVCRFIENLPHIKGKWAAKNEDIKLEPWQCFQIIVPFGWKKKANGKRRFNVIYLEVPRKNAKSTIAAGIGLYMLTADGEHGGEVYSGATSERQAWEVFKPARQMMLLNKEFADVLGVSVNAKTLVRFRDASKFEPVIGNPGDGASPSCAIIDEYHEHNTPILYDTMETGMGAREQPMIVIITTAGANIAGPCHDKHDEVRKVLDKTLENNQLYGCIYGIDDDDDWSDPKSLIKANPNYGVSVEEEWLQAQQRQALLNPVQQNKFKTKHLNVWTNVMSGLVNMQLWTLAADPMLSMDELKGEDCWFAFDLASKVDLSTLQILFRKQVNGQPHYYLFGKYWLPEDAIEEYGTNRSSYVKWVKMGLLTQTDGATVDFDQIIAETLLLAAEYKPTEIVYDPFNATHMVQQYMEEGIECVEFIQNSTNFAVPVDELTAALKDGRFHHDGNEITNWCFSNMVGKPSKKGLMIPVKQKAHQKIDGGIAAFMAMARAVALKEEDTRIMKQGFVVL